MGEQMAEFSPPQHQGSRVGRGELRRENLKRLKTAMKFSESGSSS